MDCLILDAFAMITSIPCTQPAKIHSIVQDQLLGRRPYHPIYTHLRHDSRLFCGAESQIQRPLQRILETFKTFNRLS
jgi:hypothetical protein